jgi:glyoxylase-like metal-dependent hydrolase (beta-lactamase superfamily II)/rhodanese-related sulfurtransferase
MNIKHFYDKALAQGSYAIESEGKMVVIDPPRDPKRMLEWAVERKAEIIAVLETHPHADFISCHKELHDITGAKIYFHPKAGASCEHHPLEHGDKLEVGEVRLDTLFTPGHAPDHNSFLLRDENGKPAAVFTGDSLFVGDVGRPDLREEGNQGVNRTKLASMMYDTLHNVFAKLPDDVIVYPAHGPGSLCGKNLSDDLSSTIGREKKNNWAFAAETREAFVKSFLEGQAFIPAYFPHSVKLNKKGAPALKSALSKVPTAKGVGFAEDALVIDTRPIEEFRKGHLKGAINIRCDKEDKFETWLGSIVAPAERFYLVAGNQIDLEAAIYRSAKIGYEGQIDGGAVNPPGEKTFAAELDRNHFADNQGAYTIVDVRNASEAEENTIFENAFHIPLHELRSRAGELPNRNPIVVHCAGGYRSAAAYSIINQLKNVKVFDLGEAVVQFQKRAEDA